MWGTNIDPLDTKVYFLKRYRLSDNFCTFFFLSTPVAANIGLSLNLTTAHGHMPAHFQVLPTSYILSALYHSEATV